jgi:trans-aconitate 2-methyltransferase
VPSDWDAKSYDRVSDPQERWALEIIERIEGSPSRILDAGCGSGRMTALLLDRFPQCSVVAVDASPAMLNQARENLRVYGERVAIVHADLTGRLPVDEPVDTVFSNAVFHWIQDHDALFRALAGVLGARGQLVAQCGGVGNVRRLLEATQGLAPQPPGRSNFAGVEETRHRLAQAGFTDVQVWLNDDPFRFETREAFEEYLRVVCVRCHLDLLPADEREPFVRAVADRLPDMTADYVRLNVVARLAA